MTVARAAVAIVAASTTLWISLLIVRAASTESISSGFARILKSPWAAAALADYVAGLSLSLPWSLAAGPTVMSNALWTLALIVLGNAALAVRVAVRAISHPSLEAAIFPASASAAALLPLSGAAGAASASTRATPDTGFATSIEESSQRARFPTIRIVIILFSLLTLVIYLVATISALATQPISDGWTEIAHDPWSLLTFIDNISGVLFTALYIGMREGPRFPVAAFLWILALGFLGNLVTCIYVIFMVWERSSLSDAVLTKQSILSKPIRLGDDDESNSIDNVAQTRLPQSD